MTSKLVSLQKNVMQSALLLLLCFSYSISFTQISVPEREKISENPTPMGFKVSYIINENGDTIPVVNLQAVNIFEIRTFANKREERKWSRLKRDVAKVYPYSKIASRKLKEYSEQMTGLSEKDQKRLLKRAEMDLKTEFEDDLRNMTLNQGRILIKLIDRETGNTSFTLVKDLRGSFQAFFWQSLARIFSANLKSAYDPQKNPEDKMIEDIIQTIEDGSFVN
jgi:hypothetical protein